MSEDSTHLPRPGLTLVLLLLAAGIMLAGGVWLARREVERRIPADRALLRESAATLQAELSRMDHLFLAHLRHLAFQAVTESPGTLRTEADKRYGIASVAVLPRKGPRAVYAKASGPGSPPPEAEFYDDGKRPVSSFVLGIPRESVFGADEESPLPEASEGWLGKPGSPWLA